MRTIDGNYGFDSIKVTKVVGKGPLPDLLTFDDGSEVKTADDWRRRRPEVFEKGVVMQYGDVLPAPEFLKAQPLKALDNELLTVRLITGRKDRPVYLNMTVFKPRGTGPFPTVIDGDACFEYLYDKAFISAFTSKGVALAAFNRTELAPDVFETCSQGQLYEVYPEYTFGALSAWAWGYSRCLDALLSLGICDPAKVAFSGHSRGGKTALLAGACDERACLVNPNGSGTGGCGCYRTEMLAIDEAGRERREEDLEHLILYFSYWMRPGLAEYVGREDELPFDSHFVKALIAPRVLLMTEAESDVWANPVGGLITDEAAAKVFRLLGCEENLIKRWRTGFHCHSVNDVEALVDVLINL